MKEARVKEKFLEQLRKLPNISSACGKLNISRQTIYRWKHESKKFTESLEVALSEGEDHMDDFVENKLIKKIQGENIDAIKFYLSRKHEKYMDKKFDPVLINFIRKGKNKKDQELIDMAYKNVRSKKIEYIKESSLISIDENSLKNMLKFKFISERDYSMFMEMMGDGKKDTTSEKLIQEDLENMEPKPEEVLEEYKELKKDIDQNQ
ncbi:MAG: helix-turn-helix domain-containing protein [Candidatus Pacebacteria bacterium]|nr:helix-turn-helix domain-containing protein [Candidatus Paceibacterota bacterium]